MNFSQYPEFFIAPAQETDTLLASKSVTSVDGTSKPKSRPISTADSAFNYRFDGASPVSNEDNSIWKINIAANREFTVFLVFKPNRLAQHLFQLPLHIKGLQTTTGKM